MVIPICFGTVEHLFYKSIALGLHFVKGNWTNYIMDIFGKCGLNDYKKTKRRLQKQTSF